MFPLYFASSWAGAPFPCEQVSFRVRTTPGGSVSMRVELIYTPGCTTYRKALDKLETIIAEERLPIPVELKEASGSQGPRIHLDGEAIAESAHHCIEELRLQISKRWHEITSKMLRQEA